MSLQDLIILSQKCEELEARNVELEKKLVEADRKYTEDVTHMDKKLEIAKDTLERLDKITVLAESAKYIIKEALAAINGKKL